MDDLESIAIAIQYKYEELLDDTNTNEELREVTIKAVSEEFQTLNALQLDKVADLVTDLYKPY